MVGVSQPGYHAWRGRVPSARAIEDKTLPKKGQTRGRRNGSPQGRAELRAMGSWHGRKRIARVIRVAALTGASLCRKRWRRPAAARTRARRGIVQIAISEMHRRCVASRTRRDFIRTKSRRQ